MDATSRRRRVEEIDRTRPEKGRNDDGLRIPNELCWTLRADEQTAPGLADRSI
uniref:Uncharacterized protein n=1 Tax=Cucumis melo TaxID=3656 RepID=A0A9I9DJA1_CUCME